jgi:hypothetical protein
MYMVKVASLFLALGLAQVADADEMRTFTYRLRHLQGSAVDCHVDTQNLTRRFVQLTGLSATGRCEEVSSQGNTVAISYEAEQPLSVVSTIQSSNHVTTFGQFRQASACAESLPAAKSTFEEKTGLTAFVSYCYKDPYDYDFPWITAVEGFGVPLAKPMYVGNYLFGQPLAMTRDELSNAVYRGLLQLGIDINFVRIRWHNAMSEIIGFYYGAAPIDIGVVSAARMSTPESCVEEQRHALRFLPEATTVLAYCEQIQVGGAAEVTILTTNETQTVVRPSIEEFVNYEDCFQGRDALVTRYQTEYGRPVIGGLCSRDGARPYHWRVNMIERS